MDKTPAKQDQWYLVQPTPLFINPDGATGLPKPAIALVLWVSYHIFRFSIPKTRILLPDLKLCQNIIPKFKSEMQFF